MEPTVVHVISGLEDGGAEAVLYRLVYHDVPERHVVISLRDEGKYGPLLQQAGARVVSLNLHRGKVRLGGLWRLWRTIRHLQPPVVQTWLYHADLLGGVMARLAGVRRVYWGLHNTTLEPGKTRSTTIAIARLNAKLSHWVPHRIVCCAEKTRQVHTDIGYAPDKMVVVPNGYDLQQFRPDREARARLRREWRICDGDFTIGMVARLDPHKDHGNLLAALARLKESGVSFVCALVGKGLVSENHSLVQQISRHGLSGDVLLLGQRTDIPAVMNALDVHVLSSSSEGFPNVLAEAMACGTPCVTTDVGDAAQIVGGTGWVVPPRDPVALAAALHEAKTEWASGLWSERQAAARQRIVVHFGVERMVDAYRAVWGCLLDGSPRENGVSCG